MRLGGKDEAIEYQSFSQLGKMSTALASHVDTRYWYQWPAALARYLPQKGKRRSSEANGGAWVDLENAGKLLPPRTCLGLSASAFISRHDHYPGAYEGARFQWGGETKTPSFHTPQRSSNGSTADTIVAPYRLPKTSVEICWSLPVQKPQKINIIGMGRYHGSWLKQGRRIDS